MLILNLRIFEMKTLITKIVAAAVMTSAGLSYGQEARPLPMEGRAALEAERQFTKK